MHFNSNCIKIQLLLTTRIKIYGNRASNSRLDLFNWLLQVGSMENLPPEFKHAFLPKNIFLKFQASIESYIEHILLFLSGLTNLPNKTIENIDEKEMND